MVKMFQLRLLGLVTKEIQVLLVLRDPLVPQALLVLPDRLGRLDRLVLMVAMGQMVVRGLLAHPVLPVPQDQLVLPPDLVRLPLVRGQ